ncbi:hypothetical protein PPYR_00517 [Photinus pyralis]|uniref:Uncharacterized protein n=1 Tax=Photinus pyralis TaxID=7054 RepID=A0A5N4B1S4_PHOPY|nr:filamentous growth regulator 23-like isoform X2 [Photinus pyralis]KAB0803547.1 hypothetical protein PPYR_00517 [Photinus pyralis]
MHFKGIYILLIGINVVWSAPKNNDDRKPKQALTFFGSFFGTKKPPTVSTLKSIKNDSQTNAYVYTENHNKDGLKGMQEEATILFEYIEEDSKMKGMSEKQIISNKDSYFLFTKEGQNFSSNPFLGPKTDSNSTTFTVIEANALSAAVNDGGVMETKINVENIIIVYCTDPVTKTVIAKYDKESAMKNYKDVMVVKEENMTEWSPIPNSTPAPSQYVTKNITMSIRGRIHYCQIVTVPSDAVTIETERIPTMTTDSNKNVVTTGMNVNTVPLKEEVIVHSGSILKEIESTITPSSTVLPISVMSTPINNVVTSEVNLDSKPTKAPLKEDIILHNGSDSQENGSTATIAVDDKTDGTTKDQTSKPFISEKVSSKNASLTNSFILESYATLLLQDDESEEDSSSSSTQEVSDPKMSPCVGACSHLYISSSSKHPMKDKHSLINRFDSSSSMSSSESAEDEVGVYISKKEGMKPKEVSVEDDISSDFDKINAGGATFRVHDFL